MALQRIESIYDIPAINAEGQALVATLTKSQQALVELYNTIQQYKGADFVKAGEDAKKLAEGLKASTAATKDATNASIALSKAKEAEAKATKAVVAAENEVVKQITLEEKAEQELLKTKKAKKTETEATIKAIQNEAKMIDEINNDYLQLSKAYNDAALKAKNYALRLGEAHPVTVQAVKDANDIAVILKRVDAAVGQNQRNVGNYKSAFDGLGFSVQQIGRELPSLAIGFQTFSLAISNNLPILFDEIKKARVEIAALQAAGQEAPSLFSRISSSIFSAGTALTVGITLLTLFGKQIGEFVSGLFDADDELKKHEEAVLKTSKAYFELYQAQKQLFSTLLTTTLNNEATSLQTQLDLAKAQNVSKEKQLELEKRLAAAVAYSAQQEFVRTNGFTELERLQDIYFRAGLSYNEFLENKGAGEKALSEEEFEDAKKRNKEQLDIYRERYEDQKKIVEDNAKAVADLTTKQAEIDAYNLEQTRELRHSLDVALLEDAIKTQEKIADNENVVFTERNKAASLASNLRRRLIEVNATFEKTASDVTAKDIIRIDNEKNIALKNNAIQLQGDLKDIRESASKRQVLSRAAESEELQALKDDVIARQKIQDDIATGQLTAASKLAHEENEIVKNGLTSRLSVISQQKNNEEAILNDKYQKGKISAQKYEDELKKIQQTASRNTLIAQRDAAQQELDNLIKIGQAGTKEADKLREAIAAANNELSKLPVKATGNLKEIQKIIEQINSAVQTVGQLILDATNIGYQNQLNAIQELEDAQQKNYDQQVQRINDSTLTEEQKANRLKILDAQRQIDEDTNERKRREAQQKQARFEKAINIASIIATTALAVVRALAAFPGPPITIPAAIAAGVFGAAQLAIAIATPVPQYKSGTNSSKQGWALTDEAGPETYIEPGGKTYTGNDSPTLRYLRAGTRIIPHDARQQSGSFVDANGILRMKSAPAGIANSRDTDRLIKAIKGSRPIVKNNIKIDGKFSAYINSRVMQ